LVDSLAWCLRYYGFCGTNVCKSIVFCGFVLICRQFKISVEKIYTFSDVLWCIYFDRQNLCVIPISIKYYIYRNFKLQESLNSREYFAKIRRFMTVFSFVSKDSPD
jgi:hypothetical protein